ARALGNGDAARLRHVDAAPRGLARRARRSLVRRDLENGARVLAMDPSVDELGPALACAGDERARAVGLDVEPRGVEGRGGLAFLLGHSRLRGRSLSSRLP